MVTLWLWARQRHSRRSHIMWTKHKIKSSFISFSLSPVTTDIHLTEPHFLILKDNHYVRKFCCTGQAKALSEHFLIRCILAHWASVCSRCAAEALFLSCLSWYCFPVFNWESICCSCYCIFSYPPPPLPLLSRLVHWLKANIFNITKT